MAERDFVLVRTLLRIVGNEIVSSDSVYIFLFQYQSSDISDFLNDIVSCVDVDGCFSWGCLLDTSSEDIILVLCYGCATLSNLNQSIVVVIGIRFTSVRLEVSIRIVGIVFVHSSCLTRILVEEIRCITTACIGFTISCFVIGI